ncbi:YwmB family TATA-box binding protein [Evansella sp. AB-P1]|uniref:YwmB family TATA-box binding protein n=1 Tax=Evansella sp. AB-P1 TaxID=3037653 RepID=UPI00241E3932|nr:YwmB family TATA-box binding protein [Evansella sp. AB-P1]MDG5787293.1 YwmB family TATA-box binding protein [Evansella sp. AB-P1]
MGNKWQFLAIITGILVCFTFVIEGSITRSEENELLQPHDIFLLMEERLNEVEVESKEFHIYARNHQESIHSYNEVMKYLEQWKQSNERQEWEAEYTNNQTKWIGTFSDHNGMYKEKHTIFITPRANDQYDVYTIFEASFSADTQWQENLSELLPVSQMSMFHPEDIFLRMEGTVTGDEADNVKQWGQVIIDALSADVVEDLQEETFVSLSAHTPLWEQEIVTNGEKMNVQIALRSINNGLGGETIVTIGTPLITTEY